MAGGRGTRFWPESRTKKPKQILTLVDNKSLLEETVERVITLCPTSNIHIVTGVDIEEKVSNILSDYSGIKIIAEPKGRNTAPCIGYMASRISFYSSPDDIMVILPSDHLIANKEKFLRTISDAIIAANENDTVVTVGIKPSSPNTGYGYIQAGKKVKELEHGSPLHKVVSFKEKPSLDTAKQFIKSGDYLWNAGIFLVKAKVILSEIKKHMPELYSGLEEIKKAFGTKEELKTFNKKFVDLPSESLDFGVIEKLSGTLTIPAEFGWNDLGSWNSLYDIKDKKDFGISNQKNVVSVNSKDNIINTYDGKKLIALLNVEDLIVIDTPDVLLVASRKDDQKVKEIVQIIKDKKLDEYL